MQYNNSFQEDYMYFIDLNRFGEIGANSIFMKVGSFNFIIDSGLHPKKTGNESTPNFHSIDEPNIDFIILTHCHLDHLGSLPILLRKYPKARVITSTPNLTLAPRMLRNSINVMKRQREELSISEYPLYLHKDIDILKKQLVALPYRKKEKFFKKNEVIEVTLHEAGHVLGSSTLEISHNNINIIHTGDVLFDNQRTIKGANLPKKKIDVLFLETTKGADDSNMNYNRNEEIEKLVSSINKIVENNGICLIPVFALGRMQEIFKIIHESIRLKKIKKTSIYSTGLGLDISNYFDKIRQKSGLIDFNLSILDELKIKKPDSNNKPGKNLKNKGIYIVSSGMMVPNTPSYNIAASILSNETNGVFFVGYCDPSTPGGKLINSSNEKSFYFESLDYLSPIKASIKKFDLSGHASREQLLDYAKSTHAKKIILTHGETPAREWFSGKLKESMENCDVINPKPSLKYEI